MQRVQFPWPLFVVLGACQSSPSPFDQAQRDSLELEVREVMGRLTEAMNAHDSDEVLSFYKNTEEFVYLGCTDPMFGWDFFSALVAPYYRNKTDLTFHQEILQIQVLTPDVAVVTLRGSSTVSPALFWTEVLVREGDGRWLIAHEHESWPGCDEPTPLHPTGAPPETGEGT